MHFFGIKNFYAILILILLFSGQIRSLYAHPLDVSNTTLTFYKDTLEGVTYLHPFELDRILTMSGGLRPTDIGVDTYYSHSGILTQYLASTIAVVQGNQNCKIGNFTLLEGLYFDDIYKNGFPISYTIVCPEEIQSVLIKIDICTDLPLQTNKLHIYRSIDGKAPIKLDYRVLNPKKNTQLIQLGEKPTLLIDKDGDGLSDEDELLYRTDMNLKDTDGDGYDDQEEINNSWNPISTVLSPGQRAKQKHDEDVTIMGAQPVERANTLATDSTVWGGEQYNSLLMKIRRFIDSGDDILQFSFLLVSVGLLGFLHALGPGHSKSILVAQILHKNLSLRKGLIYSLIFSVVHILDIVIVVLIAKYLFQVIDPSKYLGLIQKGSIILILIIAVYLLIHSIIAYTGKVYTRKVYRGSKYGHIFLAIIAGLTPCAFGWSIFLLLFAIKRTDLALPLLASLGMGIFICLASITLFTYFAREKIYHFSPRLSFFSPIVSSAFLLIIGSTLFIHSFFFS